MWLLIIKVEKILKGSLDLIQSPSPSVEIQIIGWKVCLRFKGKTLLGVGNKLFVFKCLLTMPSNVLSLKLKLNFSSIIWIFTECEGDWIKSRLPFKIFSTLIVYVIKNSFQSSIGLQSQQIWQRAHNSVRFFDLKTIQN